MISPKVTIHLDRLEANFDLVKKKVNGKTIMAVVKANGYGHGGATCAKTLEGHGCDFFAVFSIDEGIELRDAGIQSDILIFSRLDQSRLNEAINYNLILNISHRMDLENVITYHKETGFSIRTHLKVDTGMTRLGIDVDSIPEVIQLLVDYPEIKCEGIYSHFATADEGDLSYAIEQQTKFKSILNVADDMGYSFNNIHLSNSGAVLNVDQSLYNVVRVGMLLYGAFPSSEVPMDLPIQPVMTFKAPIVTVRKVPAGTHVSYGGVYETDSITHIGVIQCGFADGLPRPWYEKGYVSHNGKKIKIAGRICMDQFMVDFGNTIPNEGDEVLMIGQEGHDEIRIETISNAIQSTPYVIATGIGGRTKRIYQG